MKRGWEQNSLPSTIQDNLSLYSVENLEIRFTGSALSQPLHLDQGCAFMLGQDFCVGWGLGG